MLTPRRIALIRYKLAGALLSVGVILCASAPASNADASELRKTAIVKAIEGAKPAVVNIQGQKTVTGPYDQFGHADAREVNGMGTGVIVDERGFILTNYHVVQGVRRIEVTLFDGTSHYARVVSYDSKIDLAVLKINHDERLRVITNGTSSDLMIGEPVIAVGNAYGYENSVTQGIVSALHRSVQVNDVQQYDDLIQTDASINPGNSGGPLLNIDGEMIGVNVAVRAGAQGIGFAIPIDKALDVAAKLMSVEKLDSNWHGIVAAGKSKESTSPVVSEVKTKSPAEAIGLRQGDEVIEIGDLPVHRQLDIERAMLGRQPGDEINVTVRRDNQEKRLAMTMASFPTRKVTSDEKAWKSLGLKLSTAPVEQVRKQSSRYRGGLLVTDVRASSPADAESIRPGDILVGMHVWETVTMDNIAYVLGRNDAREDGRLKFYIVRNGETLFGFIRVDE